MQTGKMLTCLKLEQNIRVQTTYSPLSTNGSLRSQNRYTLGQIFAYRDTLCWRFAVLFSKGICLTRLFAYRISIYGGLTVYQVVNRVDKRHLYAFEEACVRHVQPHQKCCCKSEVVTWNQQDSWPAGRGDGAAKPVGGRLPPGGALPIATAGPAPVECSRSPSCSGGGPRHVQPLLHSQLKRPLSQQILFLALTNPYTLAHLTRNFQSRVAKGLLRQGVQSKQGIPAWSAIWGANWSNARLRRSATNVSASSSRGGTIWRGDAARVPCH